MILQSLCSLYGRIAKLDENLLAGEGFSCEKIHYALVLSRSGELVQVLDLRQVKGKKLRPRNLIVPQGPKRSVNIAPSFLWGSVSYVLGADLKGKPKRTAKCHQAFQELHQRVLANTPDEGAVAVLSFLDKWDPERAYRLSNWTDMVKGNLVFQLDGDREFVHERPRIKELWVDSLAENEPAPAGMCLVDGEFAPIARLHPAIRGVTGAKSSGASLVSFNHDAFCSYGKEQSFNSPISELNAAAYAKTLNYLLSSDANRVQIGDTTTVFWTERESPLEGFFGVIINPGDTAAEDKELAVYLHHVREGRLPPEIDGSVGFFILGLSPNASRLSVRFWHVSTVAELSKRLGRHFADLEMVRSYDNDPEFPGMWRLLRETYNHKSKEGPPPLLSGAVMQAILNGSLYPESLLSAVINRIRADQTINYMRAAVIKAVLVRKKRLFNRGMEVSVALNKENTNVAYLLGRLFAVLERVQLDAIPGANTTIKDRFYGSASATPRVAFPQILRLSQHHIQKSDWSKVREKQLEEILCEIQEFPAHLGLDQQGIFALGYYHQRQDLFKKKHAVDQTKED